MLVPVMAAAADYMKDLIKYPSQFKIGFISNNPRSTIHFPRQKKNLNGLSRRMRAGTSGHK